MHQDLSDEELRKSLATSTSRERSALIAGDIDTARAAGVERLQFAAEMDRRAAAN